MKFEDWGLVEYTQACERQLRVVDEVVAGGEERLIFCTHPPVVTRGRGTTAEDILDWSGPLIDSPRGGRATYHGPSQVVIYPILHLHRHDLGAYLRVLEETVIRALRKLDIAAIRRESEPGGLLMTGVWVGERKIASVGIAVRKWVSYHGVAVNVLHDPAAHRGIKPCGFTPETMTSVEELLGGPVDLAGIKGLFRQTFVDAYDAGLLR